MMSAAFVWGRATRGVLVAVVGAVACLPLVAGTALAGKGVVSTFGGSGSGDGQFSSAGSTAVNHTSGDVYVADPGASRVMQFDAGGSFVRAWGWGVVDGSGALQTCTSGCQAGAAGPGDGQLDNPQGIAIDQSDGSVYVVDGNNNRVEKFAGTGGYLSQFGTAGSGDGQFTSPQGVAVGPSGSVYVADSGDHRVEKFDSAGVYQAQFGTEGAGDGQFEGPTRVAVDSTGQIYVLDAGNARIERFTSTGLFDEVVDAAEVFFPSEIAVGPANDHLYVAQQAPDFSEQRVAEIDATGSLAATHGVGAGATNASGLALSSSDQRVYLADGFNTRVFVLGDLTPPTVAIDPVGSVTSSSAVLSGTVSPNGPPNVAWRFETSTDDSSWTPVGAEQDAGNGTSDVPIGASLDGLVPNTTYFVRLVATRPFNASVISAEVQFDTVAAAPDVTTDPANDVAPSHATLQGVVNPRHSSTTYYFEYGTSTAYGTSVPVTQDVDAGTGNSAIAAIRRIDGLDAGTTYHYRLVAHNAVGTVHGQDKAFATTTAPAASVLRPGIPGSPFLLNNRGWEQVSPIVKHGSDVMADSARTRAAAGGEAVSFASLGGFGDVRGSGVATEYMSARDVHPGGTGWTTHAITPKQNPLTLLGAFQSLDPLYDGEFSSDLSKGVFRAWSPVTNAPNVANVENLYIRDDLRAPDAGTYQLLTQCLACGATPLGPITDTSQMPRLAGASSDFSHVLFESVYVLTSDAPMQTSGVPNLYEWDHGTVRLVGILPDGTVAANSIAGQGAFRTLYTPNTISADGSRVFFTDNSGTGGGVDGALYMRIDHAVTLQINGSERTDCADHNPCTGVPEPDSNGGQPARYWTATPDGSKAFFTSAEQLTNDDTNSSIDVYAYTTAAPAGHRLARLSVDGDPGDGQGSARGVIGASDDGHYVYFIEDGQLVAGRPRPLGPGIYLWHDGAISYIGELALPSIDTANDLPGTPWALSGGLAARVTPDGRHLLFTSTSGVGLTGYDQGSCRGANGACAELYLYSADAHLLRCVSCNPSGVAARSDATINVRERTSGSGTTWHLSHALSDDGRHVFFTTADALVSGDANGKSDVYDYDVPSATLHLISDGTGSSDSYFADASASGRDIFLFTRQQLVGWDNDQNYDLYDARIDGGVPNPPKQSPECSGEGCRDPLGSAPATSTPGSAAASGSGNVTSTVKKKPAPKAVKCKRGFVRKKVKGKVRCVKQRKRHVAKKKAKRSRHPRGTK